MVVSYSDVVVVQWCILLNICNHHIVLRGWEVTICVWTVAIKASTGWEHSLMLKRTRLSEEDEADVLIPACSMPMLGSVETSGSAEGKRARWSSWCGYDDDDDEVCRLNIASSCCVLVALHRWKTERERDLGKETSGNLWDKKKKKVSACASMNS